MARPKSIRIPIPCAHCGILFINHSGKKSRRFCSPLCAKRSRAIERPIHVCEFCGVEYATRYPKQRFCTQACEGKARAVPAEIRFWAKVDLNGETPRPDLGQCWGWTGRSQPSGYGRVFIDHLHQVGAHVYSWQLHYGAIPEGLQVLHKCDNPPCSRPDHLFLGTPAENSADMVTKARSAWGMRNRKAMLTDEQISQIRMLYADGARQVDLAAQFGTHQTNISLIVRRKNWAHLD